MLVLIPTLVLWISDPKSIFFGKFGPHKIKVVQFGWKSAHRVSRQCWFLFRHYFSQFPTLNSFVEKFGPKNSKLFILTKNWHTWFIEDADSCSGNSFLNYQTYFWARLDWKSQSCLFHLKIDTYAHTHTVSRRCWFLLHSWFSQISNLNLEDADSYSEIRFLKFQT